MPKRQAAKSLASRVAQLSGIPYWKACLALGEPQLTVENAWLAFLHVRGDEKNNLPVFQEFLELAEIWDLFPHLGEIPREATFLRAMAESWRKRGSTPRRNRKPLFDQSFFLWADYFKGTVAAESFFEWVITEAENLGHYSRLYEDSPERLKPTVLSQWEEKVRTAADNATTLPKAKEAHSLAPDKSDAQKYARTCWERAALSNAMEAKNFAAALSVLHNSLREFRAWEIALEKALGSIREAADAMSLLALESLPEEHRTAVAKKTADLALSERKVFVVFYALSRNTRKDLVALLAEEFALRDDCGLDDLNVVIGHLDPKSKVMPKLRERWIGLRSSEFALWESLNQAKPLTSEEEKVVELVLAHSARIETLWLTEIDHATNATALGALMRESQFKLSPHALDEAVKKLALLVMEEQEK